MTQELSTARRSAEAEILNVLYSAGFTTQLMRAFVRLRIADHLAGRPRTTSELSKDLGAHHGALSSFLDACVTRSLVERETTGAYALTESGMLLKSDSPLAAHILYAAGPGTNRTYEQMADVVLTGRSGGDLLGQHLYEYFGNHLEEGVAFEEVMSETTSDCLEALVTIHDFATYEHIVDVGGGQGTLLSRVLQAAPRAKGVLFDMPHVIDMAKSALSRDAAADVVERIEFMGGSFQDFIPSGGDLYTLKSIVIDWADDVVVRILGNLHQAASPGATVLVVDWFAQDAPGASPVAGGYEAVGTFSAWTLWGGRMRTRAEFVELLTTAGFTVDRVVADFAPCLFPWNLIVAHR